MYAQVTVIAEQNEKKKENLDKLKVNTQLSCGRQRGTEKKTKKNTCLTEKELRYRLNVI